MKKSIIVSLFALLFSVASFAQEAEQKPVEFKAPTVEQIAKRRADMMRHQYLLGNDQYDKVYKLCLKQAKKDAARWEEMKKEREQMNKDMKGILNEAQWERYEHNQKRPPFSHGPRRHNFHGKMAPGKGKHPGKGFCPQAGKDFKPQAPCNGNAPVKGPKIEQPQSKKNNMFIEMPAEKK